MTDQLVVSIRAWQRPAPSPDHAHAHKRRPRKSRKPRRAQHGPPRTSQPSEYVFVFDCETTVDAAQLLRVGCFRILRGDELLQEGLFYKHVSEDELELLEQIRLEEGLALLSILEFRRWLYHYVYRLRATVVGFNLPFDLSRLALAHAPARGRFAGGWSLTLWHRNDDQDAEDRFRPRLRIKTLNNRAAFIEFAAVRREERDGAHWPGRFIDCRTLAAALSDRSLTLDGAAEIFATEHRKLGDIQHGASLTRDYVDYLRRDVLVTQELYQRLLVEYARHPIALDPSRAYSSASIGKAYLDAFGITPPMKRSDLSDETHGYFTAAFYGGRAECRIRKQLTPVTYLDVLSMYPTVVTLLRLSRFQRAARISSEDATDDIRDLIENTTLDDCFDPKLWTKLAAVVEIEPDDDIVPVRAQYRQGARSIGVNYITSEETFWYAAADVLASKLLTGKTPRIRRAIRLTAHGQLETLRPVKLRGAVEIDPATDEIFKRAIEERRRIRKDESLPEAERDALQKFLKTFANATSYGIHAELNRQEPTPGQKALVFAGRHFISEVIAVETPGRFCFMPFATLITAGARLILAMLEATVTTAGGSHVFCDTDSMAITTDYAELEADPEAQALSEREDALPMATIDEIVHRFAPLCPYDFGGGILKIEDENYAPDGSGERLPLYAVAISAKRYALVNIVDGQRIIRKRLEHGLGTYQTRGDHDDQ